MKQPEAIKKNYPLAKKAFVVGSKRDVLYYGWPDSAAQIIHAENANKAKYKFSKTEYEDYTELRAVRRKEDDAYHFEGKERCLNYITQELKLRDWRKNMKELLENNPVAKVYIYSGQWGAYWRDNACGYTQRKEEAGIYDIKEAWKNVSHCGIEKAISFELLPKEQKDERSVASKDSQRTNAD